MVALKKIIDSPTWISIFIGIVLVLWQQISGNLPYTVQIIIFIFFIFSTGIPHGAIDHLVEKKSAQRQSEKFNFKIFLLKYFLLMLFYGLSWYFFPSISLLFFLIISAEHFGETDIEKTAVTNLWNATRFFFGCFVLLWLLLPHAQETTPILARISQNNSHVMSVWFAAVAQKNLFLILSFLVFFGLFYLSNKQKPILFDGKHYLRLLIILLLTYFLPLLPAFALYFGGWHALNSLKTIRDYLYAGTIVNDSKFRQNSWLQVWKETLPFTVLATVFLTLSGMYWYLFFQNFDPLPFLFIFLSIITLPHLNVMYKMNKSILKDAT